MTQNFDSNAEKLVILQGIGASRCLELCSEDHAEVVGLFVQYNHFRVEPSRNLISCGTIHGSSVFSYKRHWMRKAGFDSVL